MDQAVPAGHRPARVGLLRLTLLIAAVIGGLTGIGCGGGDQPTELTGMTRTPQLNVSGATLPEHTPGAPASRQTAIRGPEGGLMLLYFGYTFCPDVCPTTFADLRLALAKLEPAQRDRIRVAMVTVDPKRDTGKVLNRYLGHFFDRGRFATFRPGNDRQLARTERIFGVSHRYGKPDRYGNYEVEHSAQVFAIDADGRVLVEWPFGSSPENIAADVRLLLDRIDAGKSEQEKRQ